VEHKRKTAISVFESRCAIDYFQILNERVQDTESTTECAL